MAEWLEADGRGGYAMGAADGIRTRRYHALLVAALRPPEDRRVLVADLEVFVQTTGGRFALSSHRYRGDVVHPDGAARIAAFAWSPWPRWEWALPDGTRVAGELIVEPGAARVALRWTRLAGTGAARLDVRPLLASRDHHGLQGEDPGWRFDAELAGERVAWRPRDVAIVATSNGAYAHAPDWYRDFLYVDERERGLDCEEDLAAPGVFAFDLAAPAQLAFATEAAGDARDVVDGAFAREHARRAAFPSELARAAAQYVVARGGGCTVIAGYPWFGCWGRDTFVALRGLALATGRRDVARSILLEWTSAIDGGMLPNRFGDRDAVPEYNSVDAALWFAIAADAYLAGDVDGTTRSALEGAIAAIVHGYAAGTRYRIGATPDGLLACGEPGVQLTWIDAKIGAEVITPRIGKPVEVQALWLNALAIAGRRDPAWQPVLARGRAAFVERFWDPARGYLADVVDCDHVAGTVDAALRPNQLFAIGGLPLQLVDGDAARAAVDACEHALWTPVGPRSLAPSDPRYRGRFIGGVDARDRAYHQGTVWPWLAGTFVDAWIRVRGSTPDARRAAHARFVAPLLARTASAGLGHLPEICDGDPPHRAVGCPFQAWSVAELQRLSGS